MMGLYYDETHVGQKWQLGSYHFTREAVLRFENRLSLGGRVPW